MGTRSLTRIVTRYKDSEGAVKEIPGIVMYRQYDGYPEAHGKDLAEFCRDLKVVNGISSRHPDGLRVANGAECFAAQVVTHFKGARIGGARKGQAGGIYLHASYDGSESYNYTVFIDDPDTLCTNNEAMTDPIIQMAQGDKKPAFTGTAEQFINEYLPSLNEDEEED